MAAVRCGHVACPVQHTCRLVQWGHDKVEALALGEVLDLGKVRQEEPVGNPEEVLGA
jgi:hypothetical protein